MDYHADAGSNYGTENTSRGSKSDIKASWSEESSEHGSATRSILFASIFLTLPMLSFTAILLALVYYYRVFPQVTSHDPLQTVEASASSSNYYVQIRSTLLIFLSSVSSSLAPMLSSVAMFIVAFPISEKLLRDTRKRKTARLMTPEELALTLRFINGGAYISLWKWTQYRLRRNVRQSSALIVSAAVVFVAFLLAILVIAADTWLHVTTETVSLVLSSPIEQTQDYSLILQQNCSALDPTNFWHCAMTMPASSNNPELYHGTTALEVVNNVSNTMAVYNYGNNDEYAYLGIASDGRTPNHDYSAMTYASKTQCATVTRQCNLTEVFSLEETYTCSPQWNSTNTPLTADQTYVTRYFMNSSMLEIAEPGAQFETPITNNFYYGVGAAVQGTNPNETMWYITDPDMEFVGDCCSGILVLCNTTIYDAQYNLVNGTVTQLNATESNQTVANLFQSVLAWNALSTQEYMFPAINLAATDAGSAQNLANSIAAEFNKLWMGGASAVVSTAPALSVRTRDSVLVTRLPQAPFFCLLGANLLFVVLGLILTAIALVHGRGAEATEVASRLSLDGLVADRFLQQNWSPSKRVDALLDENGSCERIGIEATQDGRYVYKEFPGPESVGRSDSQREGHAEEYVD